MTLGKNCITSDIYEFVCYLIPRCATRTLLTYFIREPGMDFGAREESAALAPKEYYRFAFIRNPYARLVSCYTQKINNPRRKRLHMHDEGLYYAMPFDEFVDYVASKKKEIQMDVHYRPQHMFVDKEVHIYRLENFSRDFVKVMNDIGLTLFKVPKLNSSLKGGDWKKYYNARTKKIVGEFYKTDLELYGYDF